MTRWQMILLYPGCIVAALVMMVWLPFAIIIGSRRSVHILIASDRLANTVFGGSDKETISSRAYRGTLEGSRGWCLLCRFLDWIEKDHCKTSEGN